MRAISAFRGLRSMEDITAASRTSSRRSHGSDGARGAILMLFNRGTGGYKSGRSRTSHWIGVAGMDRKHTEALLKALLRRPGNSPDTIEELNDYVNDLKNGELLESDARYIQALAKRLGVAVGSAAAPDHDVSEPEVPKPEVPDVDAPDSGVPDTDAPLIEVPEGSFLERARTTARATMQRHSRGDETDPATVRDHISEQLEGLAARLEEEILNDARGDGVLPIPTGHLRMALMRDGETPALFKDGNEKELGTTPGYMALSAKCDELALRLKLETGHEQGYAEPEEPPLYLVDVVISGWV